MTFSACSRLAGGLVRFRGGVLGFRGHGPPEQHGSCSNKHHDPGRVPQWSGSPLQIPVPLHEACHWSALVPSLTGACTTVHACFASPQCLACCPCCFRVGIFGISFCLSTSSEEVFLQFNDDTGNLHESLPLNTGPYDVSGGVKLARLYLPGFS